MRILLVGGAVRNLLLGRPVADKDFLLLGWTRERFLKRFPKAKEAGRAFPVFWLGGDEFAFPRAPDLDQDLAARDLTVNAMALDETGELYCHPQALDDLRERLLRPASGSSLERDPLRVFRAARFMACLPGFSPHPELVRLMSEASSKGLLADLSAERVGQELLRALACPGPGRFLTLLRDTNCLSPWFQELAAADEVPAGPPEHHRGSVLTHTRRVVDWLAEEPLAAWMGLCHDLGKVTTDKAALPGHPDHERRGQDLARALGLRLRLPVRFIKAGALAARWHMTAARYRELRPKTKVDLLLRLHTADLVEPMFRLVQADCGADHLDAARKDLQKILKVKLEPSRGLQGPEAGKALQQMRCQALAKHGPTAGRP
ncbi:MAG: HD domain-containing protein [Desulfovibrionaceae bacterium]|nr:HD domain-containing protein [Desulfovibrionaceae bacterium]